MFTLDFVKLYLISTLSFLAIDFLWLGIIASKFYQQQLGFLLKPYPNFIAAFIFYLIFTFGLTIFVISPAIKQNSFALALLLGSLFGLVTYATYDLTNLATIKNWPLQVVIIDMLWGTFIAAATSGITFKIFALLR